VLDTLHAPRFADLAPATVYATIRASNGSCPSSKRNLFDFMDITADEDGHVLVGTAVLGTGASARDMAEGVLKPQVDALGLDRLDRGVLTALCVRFGGGPLWTAVRAGVLALPVAVALPAAR